MLYHPLRRSILVVLTQGVFEGWEKLAASAPEDAVAGRVGRTVRVRACQVGDQCRVHASIYCYLPK